MGDTESWGNQEVEVSSSGAQKIDPVETVRWEGYLLFHVSDLQETLGILTTLFVVNVRGIWLILRCFVIVERCLQLVLEECLFELSGNETDYESNLHIYFGRIMLSKNSEQSLRSSTFIKE